MEKENSHFDEKEIKIVDGKKLRKVYSGYTVRQYYSHETPEKGPGPGWDFRQEVLDRYGVKKTSELPDTPHYFWEEIEEES